MERVSPYLILAISLAANLISGTSNKIFSSKQPSAALKSIGVSAFSFVSCITLYIWGGFGQMSSFTLLLGILFGVITFFSSIMMISAFALGPWSYTYVLVCLSMLLPTFSGAIFWGEKITLLQYIGTLLVAVCIVLSVEKNEADKKANLKWLFCTAIAFLASGSIGIMQKIHQTSPYAGELNEFLIVSFLTGSVLSAVMAIVLAVKNKTENNQSAQKRSAKEILVFILLFVLIGVGMAANHKLNLYLVGVLPATVFFPVVNGGALILTSLTAFIVFKEKLTKKQWIGLLFGAAAVFLLTVKF